MFRNDLVNSFPQKLEIRILPFSYSSKFFWILLPIFTLPHSFPRPAAQLCSSCFLLIFVFCYLQFLLYLESFLLHGLHSLKNIFPTLSPCHRLSDCPLPFIDRLSKREVHGQFYPHFFYPNATGSWLYYPGQLILCTSTSFQSHRICHFLTLVTNQISFSFQHTALPIFLPIIGLFFCLFHRLLFHHSFIKHWQFSSVPCLIFFSSYSNLRCEFIYFYHLLPLNNH